MSFQILVVDDEKNIREGLKKALEMENYRVLLATNGAEALKELLISQVDLIISDLRMPKMGGQELLERVVTSYPSIPVVILTGHGSIGGAVKAMQEGAYDFITKPVNLDHLTLLLKRALESRKLTLQHKALQEEVARLEAKQKNLRFVGKSDSVSRMMEVVSQVAPTRASVLITGESGVGKELIADAIHDLSPRREMPLIKVHCAALSETLLESELFGHEKGAFTNALSTYRGRFERADKGTIFLDEIGEISPLVQTKLLRVLQEMRFERVGGEKTISVDVRVVVATNRDLQKEIRLGHFREDLFYRLNVVNIAVPSLRDRREDIPLMVAFFLEHLTKEHGKSIERIDREAMEILCNYRWPGNVRELRNCLENVVIMCQESVITAKDLPLSPSVPQKSPSIVIPVGSSMAEIQKRAIESTLSYNDNNKTLTANILGIGRKTLHRKLHEYGLNSFSSKKSPTLDSKKNRHVT